MPNFCYNKSRLRKNSFVITRGACGGGIIIDPYGNRLARTASRKAQELSAERGNAVLSVWKAELREDAHHVGWFLKERVDVVVRPA